MQTPRNPLDRRRYSKEPRSTIADGGLPDGEYVFVQDVEQQVWVLPDGPHTHPRVLGNREPALYAETLCKVDRCVTELTNLSGTFRCDDEEGLLAVADWLEDNGLELEPGSVRFFPFDGGRPFVVR